MTRSNKERVVDTPACRKNCSCVNAREPTIHRKQGLAEAEERGADDGIDGNGNTSAIPFFGHVHNIDNRIIVASSIVRSVAPIYSIPSEEN